MLLLHLHIPAAIHTSAASNIYTPAEMEAEQTAAATGFSSARLSLFHGFHAVTVGIFLRAAVQTPFPFADLLRCIIFSDLRI